VRPLHGDDARVGAQRLRQLSSAHVESIDAPGAAPQQAIGEAPRGRADIEAGEAGRVDGQRIEGSGKLLATARDERRRLHELERCRWIHGLARLSVEPRAVTDPDADAARQEQRLGT
jgi:hypothetical protein